MTSQGTRGLAVQEMTGQQLSERYEQELRKLKILSQYGRHSVRFQGYPNALVMNLCRRELERRGLPVPPVNAPETGKGDHEDA
jgi:hypothetical protein